MPYGAQQMLPMGPPLNPANNWVDWNSTMPQTQMLRSYPTPQNVKANAAPPYISQPGTAPTTTSVAGAMYSSSATTPHQPVSSAGTQPIDPAYQQQFQAAQQYNYQQQQPNMNMYTPQQQFQIQQQLLQQRQRAMAATMQNQQPPMQQKAVFAGQNYAAMDQSTNVAGEAGGQSAATQWPNGATPIEDLYVRF